MVKLIALYTKPGDPAAFDKHYFETHLPLAGQMPGLKRVEVSRVTGSPMGDARYYLMAEMYFDDQNALTAALKSDEGKAAGKDIMTAAGELVHMMMAEVQDA